MHRTPLSLASLSHDSSTDPSSIIPSRRLEISIASAIQNILRLTYPSFSRTTDHLTFGFDQHQTPMPCSLFRGAPAPAPAFLYVDLSGIRKARQASLEHICCSFPSQRTSRATASLYAKRLAEITPADPTRDPYVAGLSIAIAQSQCLRLADDASSLDSLQPCPQEPSTSLLIPSSHLPPPRIIASELRRFPTGCAHLFSRDRCRKHAREVRSVLEIRTIQTISMD
ncbi:hypothetical protein BDP81DRAFT_475708 [Colletotrichum phormii]|uniref:Uncharacterized protein n=1 Tax=Colletotrichum phormii TaxID=359342 RepID=A0AAJ0EB83_9PEZI|nr:uncharacterized protein BDP81DRAFT_475708 [Colletotrichum phormii]KAK1623448.1 hypothetical protein BDP81DRAFT_475708 [Colletotrichum phormii]